VLWCIKSVKKLNVTADATVASVSLNRHNFSPFPLFSHFSPEKQQHQPKQNHSSLILFLSLYLPLLSLSSFVPKSIV
jgi:hypothetical protein